MQMESRAKNGIGKIKREHLFWKIQTKLVWYFEFIQFMKGNNINKTGHNNKEKGEEYLDFQNNISEIKKYYVQLR